MTEVKQSTTIEGLAVREIGRQGGFTVYAEIDPTNEVEIFFCTGAQVICQVTVETLSDFSTSFALDFTGHA